MRKRSVRGDRGQCWLLKLASIVKNVEVGDLLGEEDLPVQFTFASSPSIGA